MRTHAMREGGASGGEEGPLVDVLRDIASTLKQLAVMMGNIAWLADEEARERAEERRQRQEAEVVVAPRHEQGVGTSDEAEVADGTDGGRTDGERAE